MFQSPLPSTTQVEPDGAIPRPSRSASSKNADCDCPITGWPPLHPSETITWVAFTGAIPLIEYEFQTPVGGFEAGSMLSAAGVPTGLFVLSSQIRPSWTVAPLKL